MTEARDYDVIVVGGGGAGMSAATVAADSGATVLLVDAAKKLGGSTALSGGVVYAANTSVQRAAGVVDSPVEQYRYYMNVNQHKLEPSVVHRLCHDSGPAVEWLLGLGVEFRIQDLYCSGVDGVRRGHRALGHGQAIAAALEGSLTGKCVDTAFNTRILELLVEGGRVSGILTSGGPVRAAAVVLATGGFGNNPRLLAELYPDAARHANISWYIGTPHSNGDGISMGRSVGAELSGYNRGLLLLTTAFVKELEPYLPGWLVFVNLDGRRFINERTEYSVLAEVLKEQRDGECFALFDETARLTAKSPDAPNWSSDRLQHFIQAGRIKMGADPTALAEACGIRAATLLTTIDNYNAGCDTGRDAWFFKDAEFLKPLRASPYYAAPIKPAVICWTGAGLRIDRDARVLDAADRPIPGLFGAGEATGGMFGECYAGGGASVANAIIFGRVAGAHAAKEAVA